MASEHYKIVFNKHSLSFTLKTSRPVAISAGDIKDIQKKIEGKLKELRKAKNLDHFKKNESFESECEIYSLYVDKNKNFKPSFTVLYGFGYLDFKNSSLKRKSTTEYLFSPKKESSDQFQYVNVLCISRSLEHSKFCKEFSFDKKHLDELAYQYKKAFKRGNFEELSINFEEAYRTLGPVAFSELQPSRRVYVEFAKKLSLDRVDIVKKVQIATLREARQKLGSYFKEADESRIKEFFREHFLKRVVLKKKSLPELFLGQAESEELGDLRKSLDEAIELNIASDKMEASVTKFDKSVYEKTDFSKFKEEHLVHYLASKKIVFGYEKYLEKITSLIKSKSDLSSLTLASGEAPVKGAKPYLSPITKTTNDDDTSQIDLRELYGIKSAKIGEKIAKLDFKDTELIGKNIVGQNIKPKRDEINFELGDSAERQDDGFFYAKKAGLVKVQGLKIEVVEALVHEGNVDLKSGNIDFDGSAIIKGSVLSGAKVKVKGDLKIEGGIELANVSVTGNLEVKEGITSGNENSVRSEGNISCEFIANSRIFAKKDLIVNKNIVNSDCVVGNDLFVQNQTGQVVGGKLSIWNKFVTAKLGFDQGSRTFVTLGCHWSSENKKFRAELRCKKLRPIKRLCSKIFQK